MVVVLAVIGDFGADDLGPGGDALGLSDPEVDAREFGDLIAGDMGQGGQAMGADQFGDVGAGTWPQLS